MKLSDFGLGAVREAAAESHLLHTVCGTPNYAAPEVLQRKAYHGAPADVWSLGKLVFSMSEAVQGLCLTAQLHSRACRECETLLTRWTLTENEPLHPVCRCVPVHHAGRVPAV